VDLLSSRGETGLLQRMATLSMGEWWALNVIRHFDPKNPPVWQPALEQDAA